MVRVDAPRPRPLDASLGYEVARRLRADERAGRCGWWPSPGYGPPEDHRRSPEAGFDAHLVKPVDPARLAAVIAATTTGQRYRPSAV